MRFQTLEDFLQEAFIVRPEATASENIGDIVSISPVMMYVCGEHSVGTDLVFGYVEDDECYPPVQGKRDRHYAAFSSKEKGEAYLDKYYFPALVGTKNK